MEVVKGTRKAKTLGSLSHPLSKLFRRLTPERYRYTEYSPILTGALYHWKSSLGIGLQEG
ncbi:MAG: hypothetical protein QXI39_06665 [Candidatus Bathyarchaeia archaeon]